MKQRYTIAFSLLFNVTQLMAQSPNERILMGSITTDSLKRDTSLHWLHDASAYQAKQVVVDKLKQHNSKLFIQVFCGSWCEDTQRELPKFLNVADAAGLKYSFYFLDRNKQSIAGEEKKYNILFVPTFIVFYEDKEIGRVIEMAPKGIENHIAEMLK